MMECKKALVEAGGDKDKAVKILRERGLAIAGKKASRTAKEGQVAADVASGGKLGVHGRSQLRDGLRRAQRDLPGLPRRPCSRRPRPSRATSAKPMKDEVTAKIAEIGENIIVRRNVRYEVQGPGIVASYIHLGGKVGVLLEVGCEKAETVAERRLQGNGQGHHAAHRRRAIRST